MAAVNLLDYEQRARTILQPAFYDFFAGGAQGEVTLRENRDAFDRLKLLPRIMRGCPAGEPELALQLLQTAAAMPLLIAPTAFHCLAHPQGECATAAAAARAGIPMIISMAATMPVEDIVAAADQHPGAGFWFQLYLQPDRDFTAALVRRAEAAGCRALVVTADSPTFGLRERDIRHGFFDLPGDYHCAHLKPAAGEPPRDIAFDPTLTWEAITWLKSVTALPVVIKGVVHPRDAELAIEHGADAVIVSNHGGRQLDTVPATIELLPAVAAAVGGRVPVLLDGGIRRGTDIVKALALGATAVGLGRSVIWGLAAGGQAGVLEVLELLRKELVNALLLCGCRSLDCLDRQLLFEPGAL